VARGSEKSQGKRGQFKVKGNITDPMTGAVEKMLPKVSGVESMPIDQAGNQSKVAKGGGEVARGSLGA